MDNVKIMSMSYFDNVKISSEQTQKIIDEI